jgi:hypothetical protein
LVNRYALLAYISNGTLGTAIVIPLCVFSMCMIPFLVSKLIKKFCER